MLYAIIDIGSSIIKYKIYEYKDNEIEPVIIHDKTNGLISYRKNNQLTDKGIELLLETLEELKNYSEKLHVDKSFYFATASLRNITNSEEVLTIVKEKLNIDINIITGNEEAQLSFNSINWINIPTDDGILVDIGGGSSEINIFENKTPIEQKSIPIGVLKIYNNYISSLLPTEQEQEHIINEIRSKIQKLNFIDTSKEYLYGIGKTIVTVKKLFDYLGIEHEGNTLHITDIDKILSKFSSNTKENFKPLLIVDSERVHTIIPSLLIVKALSIEFNIEKIYVCDVTLQDGIILEVIENNNKNYK